MNKYKYVCNKCTKYMFEEVRDRKTITRPDGERMISHKLVAVCECGNEKYIEDVERSVNHRWDQCTI